MLLAAMAAQAQIKIGGNVYGGGNAGHLGGSTRVVVRAGDFQGGVFGGARQANVGGSAYVCIDGDSISGDITINYVYGGNDIAGTIGNGSKKPDDRLDADNHLGTKIDNYNTFVLTRPERKAGDEPAHGVFIGQLFGGGNGDYDYTKEEYSGKVKPEVTSSFVDLHGGTFGYVYAGGNNATVTGAADICINNTSKPTLESNGLYLNFKDADHENGVTDLQHIATATDGDNPNDKRLLSMGINLSTYTDSVNFLRVFGGNNKADMHIRPSWHLQDGSIVNLYSGGNEGRMTSPDGLLLEIPANSNISVANVYGGCRKADVYPSSDVAGTVPVETVYNLPGYKFPEGLAARVLVRGGDITNVYGGNDISGKVHFGNAVGIYSSIKGSVYGGGNGSYAYTDNDSLKNDKIWGDFYYNKGSSSVDSLNAHRPNAEQVSLRVAGTDPAHPVIIGGAIFVGGNSATLKPKEGKTNPMADLKIGSYVIADKVFLGNNGESMVESQLNGVLHRYADDIKDDKFVPRKFSTLNLTDADIFKKYMDGIAMEMNPKVVFDNKEKGDPATYIDYSTYFGSFYCGGNVGSMKNDATTTIDFNHKVIIFEKLVGGCNNAYVPAQTLHDGTENIKLNAAYDGGLLGTPPAEGDTKGVKLMLNLSGLKIQPKRWNANKTALVWNTYIGDTPVDAPTTVPGMVVGKDYNSTDDDLKRRLLGGNIYGGCYTSGHVNGDVVININGSIVDRYGEHGVFDSVTEDEVGEANLYANEHYHITERRSGVILDEQGMDVLGSALNVFGGGYGKDSEIWGSTTINLNKGYVFQIFGGGEMGAIGKGTRNSEGKLEYTTSDEKYSTTINLHGERPGASKQTDKSEDLAEAEFIYGGGFEGPIVGNTRINLGNGRVFNTFAGSCNADILGHTETYVGQWTVGEGAAKQTVTGFPWVRDHIYGGNDLGGEIRGQKDFSGTVSEFALPKVYQRGVAGAVDVLKASAYMEYSMGRVDHIFGGCYGSYDYSDSEYRTRVSKKPLMKSTFVHIRPISGQTGSTTSSIRKVFGAGQGESGDRSGDTFLERSYVLVDIPDDMPNFKLTEFFGSGSYNGLGMGLAMADYNAHKDKGTAVVDLIRGQVGAAYGGSYNEGVTRRTQVNVPAGSTVKVGSIFAGSYGTEVLAPCDVYEANVNYNSSDAWLVSDTINAVNKGAIYGGNNNVRRVIYGKVNINVPVRHDSQRFGSTWGTVYGAGYGPNTWSEYTEVNLNDGAEVYEVYGGGEAGRVLNTESVQQYMNTYVSTPPADTYKGELDKWSDVWKNAWTLGGGYDPEEFTFSPTSTSYMNNTKTSLANAETGLVRVAEIDDRADVKEGDINYKRYNTNVIIHRGATVRNYAYGGGLGKSGVAGSGDVYGTTYIALLGGRVLKDLYAAGTSGGVYDAFNAANHFTASANAYIKGGSARNVYGGGWEGSVGKHDGKITESYTSDVLGESHVVIGIPKEDLAAAPNDQPDYYFYNGKPAIQRNAYGGGEGGPIYGVSHITINNGYVGYDYNLTTHQYDEKIVDETYKDSKGNFIPNTNLNDSGCIFGGGYIDNSSVDSTHVTMYGGVVRNALFGGGEIAAVGRGVIQASGEKNSVRTLKGIYGAGKTHVVMFGGQVHRNVFGGGRGYNNLGQQGKLYSDGYVFGQTEVSIHGGEIGTAREMTLGNGNVFGGGDIGYVYSAYGYGAKNANGTRQLGFGKKQGVRYDNGKEGYYYKYEGNAFVVDNGENVPTEDCKVLIEPWTKVTGAGGVTIGSNIYAKGDYVPITVLNTLGNKHADSLTWIKLDATGIIIHNAVFAGGNTSPGSATVYANATSVFGNATASIHDVYHRDLITLGTGHTGGLYGDGNLTFVDGYRGLNITNYGTDYYSISKEIDIETYHALPEREAAYYELRYKCKKACTDRDGTRYMPEHDKVKAATITADDLLTLFVEANGTSVRVDSDGKRIDPNTSGGTPILTYDETEQKWVPDTVYWEENGVLPVYAGRLMNSIQRADFCGVFGSRMVMQGAQDRVPEIVDFTNYTINRVREVSLNKRYSTISSDLTLKTGKTKATNVEDQDPDDFANLDNAIHGNYFGIYNIVNYLGALTSDVSFADVRRTDNTDTKTYGAKTDKEKTYYGWKSEHVRERKRNNGSSFNKVALASGVYLELTTEQSTGKNLYEKDWGYITGVVELDLINVQTGIGGGFVYAKNEHRKPEHHTLTHATLTALNEKAVTRKNFTYSNDVYEWETSGNFVHSTQTIVDDCFDVSGRYKGEKAVPAHYWYIKGSVYVYDQYISAYTGAPNAYSETVEIPLTISAASHGTMKMVDVKPNRYAYYSSPGVALEGDKKVIINDVTYHLNDPISYWDWYLLSPSERALFVEKTYVTVIACKIGDKEYPAGKVMLPTECDSVKGTATADNVYYLENGEWKHDADKGFDYFFRESNNMSHDTGYILTYKVNNPTEWNTWYSSVDNTTDKNQTGGDGYEDGPTYHLTRTEGGELLGQQAYEKSNLISDNVYQTYQKVCTEYPTAVPATGQASFEPAYVLLKQVTVAEGSGTAHLNPGTAISQSMKTAYGLDDTNTSLAYICTSTVQLSRTEFVYLNSKMSEADKNGYIQNTIDSIQRIATVLGGISDDDLKTKKKLADFDTSVIEALSAEQKKSLTAMLTMKNDLDENIRPAYYCTEAGNYGGNYYQSGKNYRGLEAWSSMSAADRAKFAFNYDALDLLIDPAYSRSERKKYQYDHADAADGWTDENVTNRAGYSVVQHVNYTAAYNGTESLSYTKDDGTDSTATTGTELTRTEFERLANEQRHYTPISPRKENDWKVYVVKTPFQIGSTPYAIGQTISSTDYNGLGDTEKGYVDELTFTGEEKYYYCREAYTVENHPVKSINGTAYISGKEVSVGTVIAESSSESGYYGYSQLPNDQKNFSIHGISPTEVATLYVSRNSDIYDLSKEKIITVVYQYDYEESDASGNITPVSERHVVNVHMQFKSGVPAVEDIKAPEIVIPGDYVGLREPNVTPGAYEVTGGGWELFERLSDAESHINGIEIAPNYDPLYWYQDGYYVAYYARTYLGKTYSNHEQIRVANYHDLKKVMDDTDHHYYVDNPGVKRDSKIYINDYSGSNQNGLDLLKDFYELSLTGLNSHVKAGQNLEFILRTDINYPADKTWSPVAPDSDDSKPCFNGTLHGDGHYLTGLQSSLFGKLCGQVYNLGVMGSFTGGGIADQGDGYAENCWVSTTGSPSGHAIIGNPTASSGKQIVNCYYPESNAFTPTAGARKMPKKAFYNGEVAYNLNGFYLSKRYYDGVNQSSGKSYDYLADGATELTMQTGYYPDSYAIYPLKSTAVQGYVESRFADGDFRYAGGQIPETVEVRQREKTEGSGKVTVYAPIWPDDYLYFGQALNYGHMDGLEERDLRYHQAVPSVINRSGDRLLTTELGNRVYRAPAYYGNSKMDVAHFNQYAVFAQSKKDDAATLAYKGMTAIDFTGHDDPAYYNGLYTVTSGSASGKQYFFPPLLDDAGLADLQNIDLTRNLLVYTEEPGTATAAAKTGTTVSNYLTDMAYSETNPDTYRTVAYADPSHVFGHWVKRSGSEYVATRDHFLVDKQDFNAPMGYTFASDKQMWYQRMPDVYANIEKNGWEGISIPFKADIVTTQTKGELTHFYKNGTKDTENTKGHEYWLRQLGGTLTAKDDGLEGDFLLPVGTSSDEAKVVKNTFLWDYYYYHLLGHGQHDQNNDTYQQFYQMKDELGYVNKFENYPRLASAQPYIIGFPGPDYYEFDLSGQWKAQTTAETAFGVEDAQYITFASAKGATISQSDVELQRSRVTATGPSSSKYEFRPVYCDTTLTGDAYVLNAEGSSFDVVETETTATAFRPYFFRKSGASPAPRYISIGSVASSFDIGDDDDPTTGEFAGELTFTTRPRKLITTSSLRHGADVRIFSVSGQCVAAFDIQPGETIETDIPIAGVYIVRAANGRYAKKVALR